MFGLSKREMLEEPLDDFLLNLKIDSYMQAKERQDNAIMEKKAKRGLNNGK